MLEDPEDNHPMAWYRIVDPSDGSAATDAVTGKLWRQTTRHLPKFPGLTREIGGRPYLSFTEYTKWRGRNAKGKLKARLAAGFVVADWNQWVDAEGGEGAATLAGVKVGKLSCYLDGYWSRVCQNAVELANEVSRRESLLGSLQPEKPCAFEGEHYHQRVGDWKDQAEDFVTELYTLRRTTEIIDQRYFDGLQVLFADEADELDQLVALVGKLIDVYNEALASRLEGQQSQLREAESEEQELGLIIDLRDVTGKIDEPANEQVAYMVDTAKAEALIMMGENERAAEYADRHFRSAHTMEE